MVSLPLLTVKVTAVADTELKTKVLALPLKEAMESLKPFKSKLALLDRTIAEVRGIELALPIFSVPAETVVLPV